MWNAVLGAVLTASLWWLVSSSDAYLHNFKKGHGKGHLPWPLDVFSNTRHHNVCESEECKETAHTLLTSMDMTVDPCEDFYTFTCGGWVKSHPVPPTAPHRNQFDLVTEQLDYQLRGTLLSVQRAVYLGATSLNYVAGETEQSDILEEEDSEGELAPVRAAKQMYRACLDTEEVERQGVSTVCELLTQHGGWPMAQEHWDEGQFDWQAVLVSMARRLGLFPLVLLYVHFDRTNTSRNVITVDQPSLVLPRSMLVDPATYSSQLRAYRRWIIDATAEIVKDQNQNVPRSKISIDAFDVVEFEVKLAKLTSFDEMRRNVYRMHNPMTVRDLQKWTDSAETQMKLQWKDLLESLFQDINATISQNEKVEVRELDFMFNLMKLISRTPKRVVGEHSLRTVSKQRILN
ncbi:hypothetical protein PR048_000091 [Dryococelus australis]|uniref:Peptidase M13 N-terminal domain-containing protein n=1 Tax=Dryococelus australis TaxID=614101 RepID=A0ABQ9IDM8_9NEOP|nr:hypothetical protein PR048_000091 [Dryococelus australis]